MLLVMSACGGFTWLYLIDGAEKKEEQTACGPIRLEFVAPSYNNGHTYALWASFRVQDTVQVDFRGLQPRHCNKVLKFTARSGEDSLSTADVHSVFGEEMVSVTIRQHLHEGDSLFLQLDDFITCQGRSVFKGEVLVDDFGKYVRKYPHQPL